MTQRNPKNRISATAARNHKALLQIIYKTDNMNSVTQTKIKHLVNSNVIRQSDKTSGCLVLNNVSAEYGLDHKENANINTTQNIRTINKICTNFEYQTPLNGSTATLTKIKTYKYSTNKLDGSIATIKNEIAKYRRINFECSKTNPTEVKTARVNYNTTLNKDSYGYTSALAKLRTLKNGSITYR